MKNPTPYRAGIIQETLDMLILRALLADSTHGHAITNYLQRTSGDKHHAEHGSLHPARHRIVKNGWLSARWELSEGRNREFEYYQLTSAGKETTHSRAPQMGANGNCCSPRFESLIGG